MRPAEACWVARYALDPTYAPLAPQQEHRLLAEQVLQIDRRAGGELLTPRVEGGGSLYRRTDFPAKVDEIDDRAQVRIRAVVPLLGQIGRDRHAATEQEFEANAPVAEVGERHDRALADPQQMLEHDPRPLRGLNGKT